MRDILGGPSDTTGGWAPPVPVDDGWEHRGACRSEDPVTFFGPNRFEPKRERVAREREAIEICGTCPVIADCREHALAHGELYGVWGGLGETDRRALLAARERSVTARSA